MKVVAIKTDIIKPGEDIFSFLKKSILSIEEGSIVVVTSKIISFSQNRFTDINEGSREEKHSLVKKETDLYLDPSLSKYDIMLTIKDSIMAVNAGIDESNSDGKYVLWPENLQEVTNKIWRFLKTEYQLKRLGVIITDSKTIPLKWGITGTAITHCGFEALIDKRGEEDIFGRDLKMTQIQITEAVAVAGVFEMGEGDEQRPVAVVSDFQQPIVFQDRPPTEEELADLLIDPNDDVYAPVLMNVDWKKGGK